MSTVIDVVWESGVFKPKTRVDLPEKTEGRVVFEKPLSKLGEDLRAVRARIEASGVPLLTREEVLEEVRAHRGGYQGEDPLPEAPEGDDESTGWNNLMELKGCIKGGPPDVSVNHDKYLYDDM